MLKVSNTSSARRTSFPRTPSKTSRNVCSSGFVRKNKEAEKRKSFGIASVVSNDCELEAIASRVADQKRKEFALENFSKPYEELTPLELHRFAEALLKSVYLNRKNLSSYFHEGINFLLTHPRLNVIDQTVCLLEYP